MGKQDPRAGRNWYVVHTYAGYEDSVKQSLEQRIESLGMQDYIFGVVVPKEKQLVFKKGEPVEEERKLFPGYVIVDMIVTDDSWYVVRNTPRVTGFVGAGTTPVPLSQKEIDYLFGRMQNSEVEHDITVDIGEMVTIIDGPFKDFEGKVSEVDKARGKLKVFVNMFGRETPVELDFLQIRKV